MSGAFGLADAHVQGGMVGDLSFMTPELVQVSTSPITSSFLMFFFSDFKPVIFSFGLFSSVFPCWFGCIRGSNLCFEADHKSGF